MSGKAELGLKGRRAGQPWGKWFIKAKYGWHFFRETGTWRMLKRVLDNERDWYSEPSGIPRQARCSTVERNRCAPAVGCQMTAWDE